MPGIIIRRELCVGIRRPSHVVQEEGICENSKITTCPRVFTLGIPICTLKCRAYVQNFANNYRGLGNRWRGLLIDGRRSISG